MRIAIVVGSFPTISETFIVNQIISLINAGHHVTIFAYKKTSIKQIHGSITEFNLLDQVQYFQKNGSSRKKKYAYFLRWIGKNFLRIRWDKFFKSITTYVNGDKIFSLNIFFESQWFLNNKPFDIVHVHFGHNAERIAKLKSKGFLDDARLIATFHGFDLIPEQTEQYKLKYRNLFKEASLFTVNAQYLFQILESIRGKENVSILPVGLDTNYFRRKTKMLLKDPYTLIFCGRLIELKGPFVALDIMEELFLENLNVVLRIIGDGPLRESIYEEIKRRGLSDKVILLGALSQEEIIEEFEKAHIFLMPGIKDPRTQRAESQGLVIQEAQAMELPVVVSDVGGMKYGLLPGETGFVVEKEDIRGFVRAIEKLIKQPSLIQEMGKKGREFVVAHYDNEVLCNQLLALYNQVSKR